jgi:hypothetical protein
MKIAQLAAAEQDSMLLVVMHAAHKTSSAWIFLERSTMSTIQHRESQRGMRQTTE